MTTRTEWQHRKAELKARLMTGLANRAFTFRTTGPDGLAKRLLARAAGKPRPAEDRRQREAA